MAQDLVFALCNIVMYNTALQEISGQHLNPKSFSQKFSRHIASFNHVKIGREAAGHAALFLLKVAALETIRRFSRARCPFVWSGLQALQVFCYPPFKWIQRWAPFKGLANGMQILSKPLLVLSIATAFSDQSGCDNDNSDDIENSRGFNDSHSRSESHSELPSLQSTLDTRILGEAPHSLSSNNWLLQLYTELKNQGVSLPERIDEDELQRFYTAANGQELERWSNMVFWHGFDVKHRPCLIVRLGLACITLPSHDRPRFAQAVVSQVEHGILHLVDSENLQITVLVDCEGLTPLKIPMQMLRSCSALLQDHFPDRLGSLFVIRLPPVVRVIAQTFIQVVKPVTRQKLKIEGQMYRNVLTEYLQTLPSFLGGTCTCTRCSNLSICNLLEPQTNEDVNMTGTIADFNDGEDLPSPHPSYLTDMPMNGNCDQVLRTAMVGILMLWVLIAFIAGISDPESRPGLPL
ncbi:hypothetical protein F0562_000929 [Nyssa sinensis]|uniref:CRAL-TRIO domain-containing protein n=1 Tax=Nyssa sinensis TaxID=561372 RepID=A0A5J5C1F9_9ASTE|nr:hypothetical protein F0562_000929 [Nyssa sinensis]